MPLQKISYTAPRQENYSIAVLGTEKSGKTTFACSMPEPIAIAYSDPNRATVEGYVREGRKIDLYPVKTWKDFEEFVKMAVARQLEARTLVVDSWGFLSDRLVSMLAGPSGEVTIQQWGRIKDHNWETLMQLLSCTEAKGEHPGYHIVVTCHLTDVTDEKGNLIKVRPAISGSFKDTFGRCFDSVFLSRSRAVRAVVDNRMVTTGVEHVLLTTPPDSYHTCGDGVGGKGGRKALPPEIPNSFQALCAAWGVVPQ